MTLDWDARPLFAINIPLSNIPTSATEKLRLGPLTYTTTSAYYCRSLITTLLCAVLLFHLRSFCVPASTHLTLSIILSKSILLSCPYYLITSHLILTNVLKILYHSLISTFLMQTLQQNLHSLLTKKKKNCLDFLTILIKDPGFTGTILWSKPFLITLAPMAHTLPSITLLEALGICLHFNTLFDICFQSYIPLESTANVF